MLIWSVLLNSWRTHKGGEQGKQKQLKKMEEPIFKTCHNFERFQTMGQAKDHYR